MRLCIHNNVKIREQHKRETYIVRMYILNFVLRYDFFLIFKSKFVNPSQKKKKDFFYHGHEIGRLRENRH